MTKPVIAKVRTFDQMIKDVENKNKEAFEEYQKNGGICQHCGKNKAEYPNGTNPFHCKKCNDETDSLIKQLSKDPGFTMFKI